MEHPKRKAAFIKMGEFSHANAKLLQQLTTYFPILEIEVIDIFEDLITKNDPILFYHCFREYGYDIISGRKSISRSFLRTPYFFLKVRKAIQKSLLERGYIFTFQTQSLFDASVSGIPHFVYTDHTHLANLQYPGYEPDKQFSKAWIDCEKEIYRNATMVFTMSKNISRSVIEDYHCEPQKVSCVYIGANVDVEQDEILDERRYSKKNILFVGIDWIRKGGPILVEAFKRVLCYFPDSTLTIVGSSPKLNLPNCHVLGKMPLSDVKPHFQTASLFCLPTTLEPFGIVFLEAMAHKLPIIATNIGAIPDFIHDGKNGFLVEPHNSEQLSNKIIELLSSKEKLKAFGEYGHQKFWNTYTWEKTGLRIGRNIEQYLNG